MVSVAEANLFENKNAIKMRESPQLESYKIPNSCFLEDIDPTVYTNFPFHALVIYWSNIQELQNVFNGSAGFSARVVSTIFKVLDVRYVCISKKS